MLATEILKNLLDNIVSIRLASVVTLSFSSLSHSLFTDPLTETVIEVDIDNGLWVEEFFNEQPYPIFDVIQPHLSRPP